jgi:hypothetical protein
MSVSIRQICVALKLAIYPHYEKTDQRIDTPSRYPHTVHKGVLISAAADSSFFRYRPGML